MLYVERLQNEKKNASGAEKSKLDLKVVEINIPDEDVKVAGFQRALQNIQVIVIICTVLVESERSLAETLAGKYQVDSMSFWFKVEAVNETKSSFGEGPYTLTSRTVCFRFWSFYGVRIQKCLGYGHGS